MDFHYLEDKKYFINLLAKGDEERFEKESRCLFDFRTPQIKRNEFNKIADLERKIKAVVRWLKI